MSNIPKLGLGVTWRCEAFHGFAHVTLSLRAICEHQDIVSRTD